MIVGTIWYQIEPSVICPGWYLARVRAVPHEDVSHLELCGCYTCVGGRTELEAKQGYNHVAGQVLTEWRSRLDVEWLSSNSSTYANGLVEIDYSTPSRWGRDP